MSMEADALGAGSNGQKNPAFRSSHVVRNLNIPIKTAPRLTSSPKTQLQQI